MAYPALLLSFVLSVWLLRRDLRRRPFLSNALWVPTLLVMELGSRPIAQWLSPQGGERGTSLWDEVFFAGILAASLIIATSRGVRWGRFLAANIPLVLLYVFFALSVSWSGDPVASAKRIVKDFGLLAVIALIFSERNPSEAIRAVFVRSACFWFPLSIVFDRYFPRFGREFAPGGALLLSGVTGQKNTLGEMVFVFSAIVLWDYLDRRANRARRPSLRSEAWEDLLLILMGIELLLQSQSKTALICLSLCAAFTITSTWMGSKIISRVIYFAALSAPLLLLFSRGFGDLVQPLVEALGRDMTFTGRTNIWDHITLQTVNPIIGSGYWYFWGGPDGLAISEAIKWSIPNAHCGYLDIYLDGGIVGLVGLFSVLIVYGLRLMKPSKDARFQMTRLGLLAAAIVYNISESSFLRMGLLWLTTLLMMVEFPPIKRAAKAMQHERVGYERIERSPAASVSARSFLVG